MNRTKIEWCDYDKGWLTALIDGEGSISLLKEKRISFKAGFTYKPRIGISGKCIEVIERAKNLVGTGAIFKARNGVYNLDISANGARCILNVLHLIEKRKQQTLLIRAMEILGRRCGRGLIKRTDAEINELENIASEIRRLNRYE